MVRGDWMVEVPVTGVEPRGSARLLTTLHNDPSDITICNPLRPAAITLGVISEDEALKARGGKLTVPATRSLSRSITLIISPPVLATWRKRPSGGSATDRGNGPTLTGGEIMLVC